MFKEHIIVCINNLLQTIRERLENEIMQLQESLENESKSTVGDKYETNRAMIHLEQEKLHKQREEINAQLGTLETIKNIQATSFVKLGSLVELKGAFFYLGLGLGKIEVDGTSVFCISINAPVGKQLFGKKVGEKIFFNGINRTILSIL
jgi:transcription elongation GreA/GreB family factor